MNKEVPVHVKTITVWGNPGCGKSMFCCNLSKVLTAGKQKAIIINADSSTPMLPVWMPDRILETSASIGNVLTGLEINNALVAERVVILKEYPLLALWDMRQAKILSPTRS